VGHLGMTWLRDRVREARAVFTRRHS
jgi:hypothetical protein